DFYHLDRSWGVSDYDRKHMFVLSGVYGLPLGKGKLFLSNPNKFAQAVAGNWSLGSILTMNAGAPFHVFASGDIANTGSPAQRAQRLSGNPYNRNVNGSTKTWLNKAAFSLPAQY